MYNVDELDEVVELRKTPRPDIGAPLPIVVANEARLVLAYLVNMPDPV